MSLFSPFYLSFLPNILHSVALVSGLSYVAYRLTTTRAKNLTLVEFLCVAGYLNILISVAYILGDCMAGTMVEWIDEVIEFCQWEIIRFCYLNILHNCYVVNFYDMDFYNMDDFREPPPIFRDSKSIVRKDQVQDDCVICLQGYM